MPNLIDIDPTKTSGADLAALLNNWSLAVETSYFSAVPPPDLRVGQLFLQYISDTLWQLKICLAANNFLLLVSFNPQMRIVVFEGSLSDGGAAAVHADRTITGYGSLSGGGDLTADRVIGLVNDQFLATVLPNHYYGRNADNILGYWPLPTQAAPAAGAASSGPKGRKWFHVTNGRDTFTVPANVTSVWVNIYGPGGMIGDPNSPAMPGGSASGQVDVAPGQALAVRADATNGVHSSVTLANGQAIICAAGAPSQDGAVFIPAGVNVIGSAPLFGYGSPGANGFVSIEWIE